MYRKEVVSWQFHAIKRSYEWIKSLMGCSRRIHFSDGVSNVMAPPLIIFPSQSAQSHFIHAYQDFTSVQTRIRCFIFISDPMSRRRRA